MFKFPPSIPRWFLLVIPAAFLSGPALPSATAAPPANDNFADAISLTGLPVSASGPFADATRESGEPGRERNEDQNLFSVWWTWTCPVDGWVEANTGNGSYGPYPAVYTGSTLTGLALVQPAANNTNFSRNRVRFPAVAGTAYRIQMLTGPYFFGEDSRLLEIKPILPPAAPLLQKLTLAQVSVEAGPGEALPGFEIFLADTGTAIASARVTFTGPGGDSFDARVLGGPLSPENPHGIAGRLIIPPHRAPGTWSVSVELTDEFGIVSRYGGSGQPALPAGSTTALTLINNGQVDTQPPVLTSATLSHPVLNVTGSSRLTTIRIAASDDTAVTEIRVTGISPDGGYFAGVVLTPAHRIMGTAQSGIWEAEMAYEAFRPAGIIPLSYNIRDATGRTIEYSATGVPLPPTAAPSLTLTNTGLVDIAPPEVLSFTTSAEIIDTTTGAQTITVNVTVQDPGTGLGFIFLYLHSRDSGSIVSETLYSEYSPQPGVAIPVTVSRTVSIPKYTPAGRYYWSIEAADRSGFFKYFGYPASPRVSPGAGSGFLTIVNSGPVDGPPLVTAISADRTVVDVSEGPATVVFDAVLFDQVPGLWKATLSLQNATGTKTGAEVFLFEATAGEYPTAPVTARGVFTVPRYVEPGTYRWVLEMTDRNGFAKLFGTPSGPAWPAGFSGMLEVQNSGLAEGPPALLAVSADTAEVDVTGVTATVTFNATLQDALTGLGGVSVELWTPSGTHSVAGARLYEHYFGQPLITVPLATTAPAILPRNLPPGDYQWRVAAYDMEDRYVIFGGPDGGAFPPGFSGVLRVLNDGTGDVEEPLMQSLTISPEIVEETHFPAVVTFTVQAADSGGVVSVAVNLAVSGRWDDMWIPLALSAGTAEMGTWTGTAVINNKFQLGTHGIGVGLTDASENYTSYGRREWDDTYYLHSYFSHNLPVLSPQHLIVSRGVPDAFTAWKNSWSSLRWSSSVLDGPARDFDGDGWPDVLEFLCGTDPTLPSHPGGSDPDSFRAPVYSLTPTHFRVDYHLSAANAALGSGNSLTLQPQASPDLSQPWSHLVPGLVSGDQWRAEIPRSTGPRQFIRFLVEP